MAPRGTRTDKVTQVAMKKEAKVAGSILILIALHGFSTLSKSEVYGGDVLSSCFVARSAKELPYEIRDKKELPLLSEMIEQDNYSCGVATFATVNPTTIGKVITVGCEAGNMVLILHPDGSSTALTAGDYKLLYPNLSKRYCKDSNGKYIIEK